MAPNTVIVRSRYLGLNLNNFSLNTLPTLTPAQLQQIADRIQAARTGIRLRLGFSRMRNLIGITPDFENPVSYQFGGGVEREMDIVTLFLGWIFRG